MTTHEQLQSKSVTLRPVLDERPLRFWTADRLLDNLEVTRTLSPGLVELARGFLRKGGTVP